MAVHAGSFVQHRDKDVDVVKQSECRGSLVSLETQGRALVIRHHPLAAVVHGRAVEAEFGMGERLAHDGQAPLKATNLC